jgi:hypothetical protein
MANQINKRLAISKANAQIVAVIGIASFVVVFCLVASKALISQNSYQVKVASEKTKANKQLDANLESFNALKTSYAKFNNANPNVINGNTNGTGDNDGSNAKIILDSLPSAYDYPALTSSLEKILNDRGIKINSITGVDDQAAQSGATAAAASPKPVIMPFTFSVNTNYGAAQELLSTLQKSIRPLVIDKISVSGGSSNMQLTVTGHTYFQPTKTLNITKKAVK